MKHRVAKIVGIGVVAIAAVFVFGFAVMYLWNWLMPELFGLKQVSYWQAWGLLALSWILFGGLRGHGHRHHGHWRHRMHERWGKLTPEEKARFKEEIHRRWHHHHDEPPASGNAD
jgi:hypothetical protein